MPIPEITPRCDSTRRPNSGRFFAMVISTCQHDQTKKHGKDRNGNPRRRCCLCGKTFIQPGVRPLGDMRISVKEAAVALGMLLEGMSVRGPWMAETQAAARGGCLLSQNAPAYSQRLCGGGYSTIRAEPVAADNHTSAVWTVEDAFSLHRRIW